MEPYQIIYADPPCAMTQKGFRVRQKNIIPP